MSSLDETLPPPTEPPSSRTRPSEDDTMAPSTVAAPSSTPRPSDDDTMAPTPVDVAHHETMAAPVAPLGTEATLAPAAVDLDATQAASGPAGGVRPDVFDGDTLASARQAAPAPNGKPTDAPAKIDRHVIVAKLGAGGMGVVYSAYDPELDRRIAIKLIRGAGSAIAAQRLQREAQAMARVNHPNVISVYDVGMHESQVFVAMEYVEGTTLGGWLEAERRSLADVLEIFERAGRGLIAAHAVGLAHRDFKPDNVMVGKDGRVRVMDFGLAQALETEISDDRPTEPGNTGPRSVLETAAGAIVGTPAYMSPEQFEGRAADARSDQFSFCVALWEALYGQRPFEGDTYPELVFAVTQNEIREPDDPGRVPRWIREHLQRGMATDREHRFPDMQALLDALAHDPIRRRRRFAAGGGLVALGIAGMATSYAAAKAGPGVCDAAAVAVDASWNDERRAKIRAGLIDSGVPFAADAAARVERGLDDYLGAWSRQRTATCEATRIRGESSDRMMDLKMRCLDDRLEQADALITIFETADAAVVEKSVQAVAQLPSLARCDDEDFLLAAVAPPEDPELASAVDDARRLVARVRALVAAGKYPEALEQAQAVAETSKELGYDPLEAEVQYWLGVSQIRVGELEAAAAALERGYWRGLASGHEPAAIDSATELVYVVGYREARHEPGLVWSKHARALEERLLPEFSDPGRLDNNVASLRLSEGDLEAAEKLQTAALEARREKLGKRHPEVANALLNLGNIQVAAARYDEAEASYDMAREIFMDLLGPTHPLLGTVETSIGNLESTRGNYDASREHFETAIEIVTTALGPEHTRVGNAWLGLGYALSAAQDEEGAEKAMRKSLEVKRAAHGDDHPEVALAWGGLADQLQSMGELERAHEARIRAYEISRALYADDNVNLAAPLFNLGEIERVRGLFDEALPHIEGALALWTKAHGEDHPNRSYALEALGKIAHARGDLDGAVDQLEQALALREKHFEPDSYYVSQSRFSLAEALIEHGTPADQERAVKLAKKARAGYEAYGDPQLVAKVDAWLRAHDG